MTALQGLATFPGIGQLLDASLNFGHGISPSTATLTIVPQAQLTTDTGTLAFTFGDTTIAFPDCKIDRGTLERNSRGEIWRLSILDRRWKWRFGAISGTYNAYRDDSSLRRGERGATNTERTMRQLAELCLLAMGETRFDVSALPNEPRPSVEWDVDVPAEMLAALCDQCACRVVLTLDDRVVIHRAGVGAQLSSAGALEFSALVNPPELPDALAVVCGASRYQVDFALEAVGVEPSDSQAGDVIQALDLLSYRPAGGWSRADLPYFHQVNAAARALAQRSVFRYYRIQSPVFIPGYTTVAGGTVRLEQILPIEDEQVTLGGENGQLSNKPAAVFGIWHAGRGDVANTAEHLIPAPDIEPQQGQPQCYSSPFTIDAARGLVIFEEPVYRNLHASATGGGGFEIEVGPAQLVLRAACSIRDSTTLESVRYVRIRPLGSAAGETVRYLKHEELALTHVPRYSPDYALQGVDSNLSAINQAADGWLDAAQLEYVATAPQTVRYAGLVPVELDGAIEHVGFHVGQGGATTTATRQAEPVGGGVSQSLKRRLERQHEVDEAVRRTRPRHLSRILKGNSSSRPRPRS